MWNAPFLDEDHVSILQTDTTMCGGVTEFRRSAQTAASFGVNLCPHWFRDLHAPLVAAIPNGEFVECFTDSTVLNFRRLLDRQMDLEDGDLVLHADPELGFDFDPAAVERYAVLGWD